MDDVAKQLVVEMRKSNQPKSRKRAEFLRRLARAFVKNNEKLLRISASMTDTERLFFQSFAMEEGMKRAKQEAVEKVNGPTKKRRRRAA